MNRGYRATRWGVVHASCPDWPLDWHELFVLAVGFSEDERCHLHRALDPDWEWKNLQVFFASQALHTLQGANWQRGGGKGQRPKIVTAKLLRGGSEPGEGDATKSGVRAGTYKPKATQVSSVADLEAFRERFRSASG